MENTKTSMVFYESAYAAINYLPTTELKWEAAQGLLNYGFYGIEPESDNPFVNMIYVQAIPSMRNAKQRYEKAVDNGKKGGRPTEISTEQIMQMKKDGMTNKQIAEQLGCTVSNVENRITIYNKTHPNNPNNLSVSVSVSVSDSVSSSVSDSVSDSARASTHEEEREEKRELEDLSEKELKELSDDYKGHMSYKDIAAKYSLARVTKEMCDSVDNIISAKVADRQEAEQRIDAELEPVYSQLATYLGGRSTVKGYIKSLNVDAFALLDFTEKNPQYSFAYWDDNDNNVKKGFHRKDNVGELIPNVPYKQYLLQGINTWLKNA